MEKISVKLINNSKLKIDCDNGVAWELREYFSFFVPGYKFMPKYRNGIWDGKIRVFEYSTRTLPAGLWKKLVRYCDQYNYHIDIEDSFYGVPGHQDEVDPKKVMAFIESLNLHSKGEPITIREYQFDSICRSIRDKRLILLSPTGSGKSLIIYVLMRWWQQFREDKTLVIVPTTSLVEQMYSDFADYSSHDKTWDANEELHKIYSGQEKTNVHNPVFISTWQSIYKLPKTWFEQFGVVFGDEAHGFTSNSLVKSMDKAWNAEYRIGTTGTLDGSKTNKTVLEGIFGPVVKVTTTKKLQDDDTLAKLNIKILDLHYSQNIKDSFTNISYHNEIEWLISNQSRNEFLMNLALSLDGNTLILFRYVDKHGKILYDMIRNKSKHRCFFVAGDVEKQDREAIRNIIETQKKSITVASLGVFSTGVNIKELHNIIFASPSKGQIKVLQSIGRSLRKSKTGKPATLYDPIDHLTNPGSRENYSVQHGKVRLKIYDDQEFNYKRYKVKIK